MTTHLAWQIKTEQKNPIQLVYLQNKNYQNKISKYLEAILPQTHIPCFDATVLKVRNSKGPKFISKIASPMVAIVSGFLGAQIIKINYNLRELTKSGTPPKRPH